MMYNTDNNRLLDKMKSKIIYNKAGFDENTISDYIDKYLNPNFCYNFGWGSLNKKLIKNSLPKVDYDDQIISVYNGPKGQSDVIKEVVKFIKNKSGIKIDENQIMLVNGATNGIFLLAHYFSNIHNIKKVIIQNEVFDTALNIFNSLKLKKISVDADCSNLPKTKNSLAYLIFKFQNPTGISVKNTDRIKIIKKLIKNNNYVIEDDAYGLLTKNGKIELLSNPKYIYLSSFSKYIFPGLRLGFIIADPKIISDLQVIQKYYNSHPNIMSQYILYEYLKNGTIDDEISHKVKELQERRQIFEKHISSKILNKIKKTDGGFYYWIELSHKSNSIKIFVELLKKGVIIIPGDIYFVKNPYPSLRISISLIDKEKIENGCKILNEVLEKYI